MEHIFLYGASEEKNTEKKTMFHQRKKNSSWEEKIFHGEKEVRTCEVLDKMSSTLHDL